MCLFDAVSPSPFFLGKMNGVGNISMHPLQRVGAAFHTVACGTIVDAVDEYVDISEASENDSPRKFCKGVVDIFRDYYLCAPGVQEMI